MKKAILLIFVLFLTTEGFSQGILNLYTKSQAFFKLLDEEKYTEAQGYFDSSVQSKVSPENLKQLWENLAAKLGKLQSVNLNQGKVQGEFFAESLEGTFEKDTQNFLLVYNKAENLVGLFLQPKSNAAAYLKPAYADTALYKEKEIYVKTAGHSLVGLLTTPKKAANFPIVVLVHGSGPGDMDETIGPNKPFKDLAAGLAAKGIATIRYVKRTLAYPNEFGGASTVKEEVMDDALAALALAKTIPGVNKKQIYLLGHSLGGMLAPRIAAMVPDLGGIILAAAPARKFTDMIVEQNKYMFALSKDTVKADKLQLDSAVKALDKTRITKLGKMKPDSVLLGLPAAYWVDLNVYDQLAAAKKLNKQRILVIQGGNDFQVSVEDYNLWKNALGKKKNTAFKLYPDLNHLLSSQPEKGSPKQYQTAANVSETLINDMALWINNK